jgi:hypothetical protein
MNESNSGLDAWPHPSSFPVGSDESRAAARAMFQERDRGVRRLQIVNDMPRPIRGEGDKTPRIGPWTPMEGGGFVRLVNVSPQTNEETIQRILATP